VPRVLGAAAVFAASRQTQAAVSDFASAQAIWYVGGGRGQERQAMSDRELPRWVDLLADPAHVHRDRMPVTAGAGIESWSRVYPYRFWRRREKK
jgi:hypothetical protein